MGAFISFSFFDLGRHVSHRASVGFEAVDVLVTGETKVGNFKVELLVNEDVFELQVSVDNFSLMHIIGGVEHLHQEEPSGVFSHGAHHLAEVEQETTLYELHDDVDEVGDDPSGGLDDLSGVAVVSHADDAAMVQVLQDGDFVLHRKDGVFVSVEEFLFENLDGCESLGVLEGASKVHLRGVAFAEALEDFELVVEDGMSSCGVHSCVFSNSYL